MPIYSVIAPSDSQVPPGDDVEYNRSVPMPYRAASHILAFCVYYRSILYPSMCRGPALYGYGLSGLLLISSILHRSRETSALTNARISVAKRRGGHEFV